jgi:hypothetical protein
MFDCEEWRRLFLFYPNAKFGVSEITRTGGVGILFAGEEEVDITESEPRY